MPKFGEEHQLFGFVPNEDELLKNIPQEKAEQVRGHMTPTEIALSQERNKEILRVEDNKTKQFTMDNQESGFEGFLAIQRDEPLDNYKEYTGVVNGHKIFIKDGREKGGELSGTIEDEYGTMDLSKEEINGILKKYATEDRLVSLTSKEVQAKIDQLISIEIKEGLDNRRKKALRDIISQS
jgi:hypothetical protein